MHLNNPLQYLLAISILYLLPVPLLASLLEESVSYCEHLVECESSSRMQERICTGNTILMPYWLPSLKQRNQECHLILKNDYIMLERIERQLEGQMLSCYIEQTLPLGEEERTKCDSSLLNAVRELRNASGHLIVDNCFQGTATRIERQCGGLRRCCTARKICSDIIRKSFLNEEKTKRIKAIWKKAKDCEMGLPVEELVLSDAIAKARRVNASDTSNNPYEPKSELLGSKKNSLNEEKELTKGDISTTEKSDALSETDTFGSGQGELELGLSIHFNGNAAKSSVNDSDVDKAILSLVAASLAASKIDGDVNLPASGEGDENSSEITKYLEYFMGSYMLSDEECVRVMLPSEKGVIDDGPEGDLWQNSTDQLQRPSNEFAGGCVDVELVKNVLAKWYNRMIAELREEFKKATTPEQVNLTGIVEQFDPKNNPLFIFNSTSFNDVDYPVEDAKIAATIADPLESPMKTNGDLASSFDENSIPVIEVWKETDGGNTPIKTIERNSKENIEMKWENDEYRKQIELYRQRKNRNHLFATMEERNLTPCDLYVRCRHQVVRALDTCVVLSGQTDQQSPFALSTESLLEIGDHCNGEGYDAFNRLYELVILRNKRLRKCLNESDLIHDDKCSHKLNNNNRQYTERLSSGNYTDPRECYSDVNSLQFECAQLRPCCPYFFRCREQTSDTENESEIIALTSQLSANNHRCLQQTNLLNSTTPTTGSQLVEDSIKQRTLSSTDPTKKMAILPSSGVENTIIRHSFPPDSKKS